MAIIIKLIKQVIYKLMSTLILLINVVLFIGLIIPTKSYGNDSPILLKDIRPGYETSRPDNFIIFNNKLFFTATVGGEVNNELWVSDGTEDGTVLFKEIYPGGPGSYPSNLTVSNNTLFFAAFDPVYGGSGIKELWKSDGTESGTVAIDTFPGIGGIAPQELYDFNGLLIFRAFYSSTSGWELWKSDGTSSGTVLVKDICPGTCYSTPTHFTSVNNTLFFLAGDGVHGYELWRSDGTEANTNLVKDVYPGNISSASPLTSVLHAFNDTLFFTVRDGIHGVELWKTDGTAIGTAMVKDICPGTCDSYPTGFINYNNLVYFKAGSGTEASMQNIELWKTDGTEAGTVMVKDISPGDFSSYPADLTIFKNEMYFGATGGVDIGKELWKSDGTESGTVLVKDIFPGKFNSSYPRRFTNVQDARMFFIADDGVHGNELWMTDGIASCTVMVKDIYPGENHGFWFGGSINFAYGNGQLYFSADDGINGKELWLHTSLGVCPPGAKFTPLPPCRLFDTRITGSMIATEASKPFFVWEHTAGDIQSQGGTGDCGVPATAKAVVINLTATEATANGHFRIYPFSKPLTSASIVNFSNGVTMANATEVPICQPACAFDINIYSSVGSHAVGDVMGYFE